MKYQSVKSIPSNLHKSGVHIDCFSNSPVCCSTQPKNATCDNIINLKRTIGFIYLAGCQPPSPEHPGEAAEGSSQEARTSLRVVIIIMHENDS